MDNNKIEFEDLPLDQKKEKLIEVLKNTTDFNIQGTAYDISYNRLKDNQIVYVINYLSKDSNGNDHYIDRIFKEDPDTLKLNEITQKDIENKIIKLDQKIDYYRNYEQVDISTLIKQREDLFNKQFELKDILENKSGISLSQINVKTQEIIDFAKTFYIKPNEIECYDEIDGNKKQIEQKAKELNVSEEQVKKISKFDEKNELKVDANKLSEIGIKSNDISGNEKITFYNSLNDILGYSYDKYRVIKSTIGASYIVGINKDGTAEKINDNRLHFNNALSMSRIDESGLVRNSGVMLSFTISEPMSKYSNKQTIGLYSDNTGVGAFYGRTESNGKILGKNIEETSRPVNVTNNIRNKEILDLRRNPDASSEIESADARVSDGCIDKVENIATDINYGKDLNDLINESAVSYDIDVQELKENVEEGLQNNHEHKLKDQDIVEIESQNLVKEKNENDQVINKESDEEIDEHDLGTPWGHPYNSSNHS